MMYLSSSRAELFNRKVPHCSRSDRVFLGVYREIFSDFMHLNVGLLDVQDESYGN